MNCSHLSNLKFLLKIAAETKERKKKYCNFAQNQLLHSSLKQFSEETRRIMKSSSNNKTKKSKVIRVND